MSEKTEYWQRFDPSWRRRGLVYDRGITLPPSDRKGLSSGAATAGNVAPGVDALERGAAMLRHGNLAGRQALIDGFRWIVEAMDRHGYVDLEEWDEEDPPTRRDMASAAELADIAVRRFHQGYEKAAFEALQEAIHVVGGDVVL